MVVTLSMYNYKPVHTIPAGRKVTGRAKIRMLCVLLLTSPSLHLRRLQ